MHVIGIDGMPAEQILDEILRGGKFVTYEYCVSAVFLTLKRKSDIYYVRPGESRVSKGMGFSAMSFALGWWGFPWGFIHTMTSLVINFRGGNDVTMQTAAALFPMEMAMRIPPGGWARAIECGVVNPT